MKATAAVCTAPNNIVFDQVEVREPEGTELRVKITAVGICGTDLTAIHGGTGMFPLIAGHEGAGIVEAVSPDVTRFKVGDRVGITYASCGKCKWCQMGKTSLCDSYLATFSAPAASAIKTGPSPTGLRRTLSRT